MGAGLTRGLLHWTSRVTVGQDSHQLSIDQPSHVSVGPLTGSPVAFGCQLSIPGAHVHTRLCACASSLQAMCIWLAHDDHPVRR